MKRHGGRTFNTYYQVEEANHTVYTGCILCNSNCITFQKKQNYGDSKKISACQGRGEGQMNRVGGMQYLGDSETTLCHTVMVGACLYAVVQTQNASTKNEP